MLQQPRPDYIVKPMPATIPDFEIAPLERAHTDRAANAARFGGETPAQREFRSEGESKANLPMLFVAAVALVALAFAAGSLLYGAFLGAAASYAHIAAHPALAAYGAAGLLGLLIALVVLRMRAARKAHAEAHADTIFGELA